MGERIYRIAEYVLFILLVLGICGLVVVAVEGCSSVRDAPRIEEMSDAEADAYAARVAMQVGVIAQAALDEEDVTPETLEKIASGLEGLAVGTSAPAAGGIAAALEVDGYGSAIIALAIVELDAEMSRRGALEDDGALSPRARLVLAAVAARLHEVASQE